MDNRLLSLVDGDLVELRDARGATLRVDHGSVWVTQERGRHDIVLRAGDAWTIERGGVTVAEARGDTALRVAGNDPAGTTVRTRRIRWQERVSAWLATRLDLYMSQRWLPYV